MTRLVLLCSLLYGVLFLGLMTLNGGVVALAVPLAIVLGATLLYGPHELQLTITRTLSEERVYADTPVIVRLAGTNEAEGRAVLAGVEGIRPCSSLSEAARLAVEACR